MRTGLVQDKCWVCGSDILAEDNFCRSCGVGLKRADLDYAINHKLWNADRQMAIGIFLSALGAIIGILSYFMGIVPMLAFGLACFLLGIMALYLPEKSGGVGDRLAADLSLPSLLNIEKLLEDLDLDERGIYIPASGLGVCPKVFVPMVETPATRQPPVGLVGSHRIFVTVGKNPEDRGILLDAPGAEILVGLERTLRLDFAESQLDSLGSSLDSGFKALGMAKVTAFQHEPTMVRIEMELMGFVDLEVKLRNMAPRVVAQVGTPLASSIAAAVSKATGKYAMFKSTILDPSKRKVNIHLKLSEKTGALAG